jgi:hypothetical protein
MPWSCLLLISLCVLTVPAGAQPAGPAPRNGSFEQLDSATGRPAGWTVWNAIRNLAAYSLARAHDGVACASISDDNGTDSQGLRSPRVPITPGQAYAASGWVWIDELQAGGFALYLEFWAGGERVADYSVVTGERGRWVELRVERPAPPAASEATVLVYGSSATIGHACFDDIALSAR